MNSNRPKIFVSACLVGENCKYDGGNNRNEKVLALAEYFRIVPFCPEIAGGLDAPRHPCEICCGRVLNDIGEDKTKEFEKGAERSLEAYTENGCVFAILKSRSPSCGKGIIYDGSFTHTVTEGNGVTAKLFADNGIKVYTEDETDEIAEV